MMQKPKQDLAQDNNKEMNNLPKSCIQGVRVQSCQYTSIYFKSSNNASQNNKIKLSLVLFLSKFGGARRKG